MSNRRAHGDVSCNPQTRWDLHLVFALRFAAWLLMGAACGAIVASGMHPHLLELMHGENAPERFQLTASGKSDSPPQQGATSIRHSLIQSGKLMR